MNIADKDWEQMRKWMFLAARLEGLFEAHKVLKGDKADEHDLLIWQLAEQMIAEANDE